MPNIKGAKKRVLTNNKSNDLNKVFKSKMRHAIKKVEELAETKDKKNITEALKTAFKELDKALTKGIVHKNFVSRQKSRLTKLTNEI